MVFILSITPFYKSYFFFFKMNALTGTPVMNALIEKKADPQKIQTHFRMREGNALK
jgi:hypothetical protein